MCHQHAVTCATAAAKKKGKRSRLWQGDCWMVLPWRCQVRFILPDTHIYLNNNCYWNSQVLLFSYFFLFTPAFMQWRENTSGSDFLHLSFAHSRDVMRYLYHLKWILCSLSCEQNIYSRSSAGRPLKKIWIYNALKQHIACGIQWAFINLYICSSSYLHQVRQAESIQTV